MSQEETEREERERIPRIEEEGVKKLPTLDLLIKKMNYICLI
jgi:hypothetical protein